METAVHVVQLHSRKGSCLRALKQSLHCFLEIAYRIRAYRTPLLIRTPGDTFWAHIGHFRQKIVEKR